MPRLERGLSIASLAGWGVATHHLSPQLLHKLGVRGLHLLGQLLTSA